MFNEFELLTVAETATAIRCSSSTVYTLIHSGKLKSTKRGKSYFVSKASLHSYIERLTTDKINSDSL